MNGSGSRGSDSRCEAERGSETVERVEQHRNDCGSAVGAVLSVGVLGHVTPEQLLSENAQLRAQLATGTRRLVSAAVLTKCIHCTVVLAFEDTRNQNYLTGILTGSVTG